MTIAQNIKRITFLERRILEIEVEREDLRKLLAASGTAMLPNLPALKRKMAKLSSTLSTYYAEMEILNYRINKN